MNRFLLYFLLLPCVSLSQKATIDSLKQELKKDVSTELRIDLIRQIGFVFFENQTNYDSAFYYAKSAYNIAKVNGLKLEQAKATFDQARILTEVGNETEAIDAYKQAIELSTQLNNLQGIAFSYNNLGVIYGNLGDHDKSIEFHQLTIEYSKELDAPLLEAANKINIGQSLYHQEKFEEAKEIILAGMRQYDSLEVKEPEANLYLAKVYSALGSKEAALEELMEGYQLATSSGTFQNMYEYNITLADLHFELQNFKEASLHSKQAIIYNDSIASLEGLNGVEKVKLKFRLKEQEAALLSLKEKNKYLNTIYLLIALGVILAVILILRQLKIVRMTKNIRKIQNTLVKEAMEQKNDRTTAFEATIEGDKDFLKM